jgi:hypothetical protein
MKQVKPELQRLCNMRHQNPRILILILAFPAKRVAGFFVPFDSGLANACPSITKRKMIAENAKAVTFVSKEHPLLARCHILKPRLRRKAKRQITIHIA